MNERSRLPENWRPPAELTGRLNTAPWTQKEAQYATYAIRKGIKEISDYYRDKPDAIFSVGADTVESLIQVTYASANTPAFDKMVRRRSRQLLSRLIEAHIGKPAASVICEDFVNLLPLAIFAHSLAPEQDRRTAEITKRTNMAYRDCGSLLEATDYDLDKTLKDPAVLPADLMNVYIWALWFNEATLYPDIELPDETKAYASTFWDFLRRYPLKGASDFEAGRHDERFIANADLAPHVVHLITGTNRYPIRIEDDPRLYRYHRENFYAVMQTEELDLFASFVDTLRQYGCTETNDVQVRDGTRFLLQVFYDGGGEWMDFRQDGETDDSIDAYGLVHYPWTAVLGIRPRKPEQPQPDNLGGIIQRWLSEKR
ncbi:hypothetical protein CSC94_22590 [Zhengella mangrovi]|uniref:Uncharacterized protein n=1 Tax=Zhengella mangrovi TaxID=1982044 RepID=A0A2G1QH60_9HYPH|nr:hypothetical protein CSC94_22590 [Zhengella mangrovi]